MMRRLLNILFASLLSLMVVYLSVGTTIMHCLRSNEVRVVMVANDCCAKACDDCCAANCQHQMAQHGDRLQQHCMDYKQLKLSPTLSIQKAEFDSTPVFAGVLPAHRISVPRPSLCMISKAKWWNYLVPHAPPRDYLAFINILII